MHFTIFGSNNTIIVVNQTNIGGGGQSNTLLIGGFGYGAGPRATAASDLGDSFNYKPIY